MVVAFVDDAGVTVEPQRTFTVHAFLAFVRAEEAARRDQRAPRWVWEDTASFYPLLLAADVRVQRCHDLRLCHTILRNSSLTQSSDLAAAAPGFWDAAPALEPTIRHQGTALFELQVEADPPVDTAPEFHRQLAAVAASAEPRRIRLLLAAESAGALVAAEMRFAGLPWDIARHESLLTRELGPRVPYGVRPERLEELAGTIRALLGDRTLNPDSQQDLLKALQNAGLPVTSTQQWHLKEVDHPVIEPLLHYRKLSRLLTANGWSWLDAWIVDGRFHAEYLPGGVVTGRWAARGGGALQLPKQVRGAVIADPGWTFVVADAAQLEPRILAALSADLAMARAGHDTDLYAGIVASGVVETRAHAKVAMLGAMYGATTGESGRLLPRLARAYPRALALTEAAARTGERGDIVTTRLGRSSPRPPDAWLAGQAQAYAASASGADERRARSQARDWGRFTRNFVVQGSAAEWALCWMAEIRQQLWLLDNTAPAAGLGPGIFASAPHLVFFLHDEIIVHTPIALAEQVTTLVGRAATSAGKLLFGDFPVDFPLTVATVANYADAK
ncbi:bifunctional 3'-5' exonuclease/DNA polymerase [Cryobacterium melibiosiphilum]|uniref:DNA-directed DNA polymerase n=1 Tax=Cryobacterium melibiosiphilum TaxID=995039 RepID=A0A3A5MIH7_9MICO|nr:bifunctional 3'-5' exonuclease/DNA polymerase [Cryobacterium melibiosiphilum]